jgi:hypothetical protein
MAIAILLLPIGLLMLVVGLKGIGRMLGLPVDRDSETLPPNYFRDLSREWNRAHLSAEGRVWFDELVASGRWDTMTPDEAAESWTNRCR